MPAFIYLFLVFLFLNTQAVEKCEDITSDRVPLERALERATAVAERQGLDVFGVLKNLAQRILIEELKPNEGIPIEYYEALLSISRMKSPKVLPTVLRFFGSWGGATSSKTAPLLTRSELSQIYDILKIWPAKLDILAYTPRVFEGGKPDVYVLTKPYNSLDMEKYTSLHEYGEQPEGFYSVYNQKDINQYVPLSGHLIGKHTIITIYGGKDEGVRWITGEMLGSVNDRWETYMIREAVTGDVVLVPARNRAGRLRAYYFKPDSDLRITKNILEGMYPEHRFVFSGGFVDLSNIGKSDQQIFLVEYPTHTEVIKGRGSVRLLRDENSPRQVQIPSETYVSVITEQGIKYFFSHRFLRAYSLVREEK